MKIGCGILMFVICAIHAYRIENQELKNMYFALVYYMLGLWMMGGM